MVCWLHTVSPSTVLMLLLVITAQFIARAMPTLTSTGGAHQQAALGDACTHSGEALRALKELHNLHGTDTTAYI